jgi:two-component system response regulator (stage 0 sporulation protein F)
MMLKNRKILVVDDEPDLREILKDELTFEGALVSEAKNGKEALEMLKNEAFEAVLSDIRMPGGDGVGLLKDVRSLELDHIKMFLLTGFADIKNYEAYHFGADGFFTKPFHLDVLRESLEKQFLEPSQRWAKAAASETLKAYTDLGNFEGEIAAGRLAFGRGGLFAAMKPLDIETNDLVHLKWADFECKGVVRWVRSDLSSGLPPGYGVEFLELSPSDRAKFQGKIAQKPTKAFIPQGP